MLKSHRKQIFLVNGVKYIEWYRNHYSRYKPNFGGETKIMNPFFLVNTQIMNLTLVKSNYEPNYD